MPNAQYFEKTGNKFRVLVTQSAEVNVIKPLPPYAIKKWNAWLQERKIWLEKYTFNWTWHWDKN